MRRINHAALALALALVATGANGAAAQTAPERSPAGDGEALQIFIVSAGVGVSANPRARTNTPCDITGIVRNHCAAAGGGAGCEISDGQLGAAQANLFTGTMRTDIMQSCGLSDLSAVRAFGVTYVCRGARTSRTVGAVVRHERPASFGPDNQPKQLPAWRIVMACR